MVGVITWIAVGGAVGYAICGPDARTTPAMWIPEVAVGAASGFVGGGLAALFWNHASTNIELLGLLLAALSAAVVTVGMRAAHVTDPRQEQN